MNEELNKFRIWSRDTEDVSIFAESMVDTIREPLLILDGELDVVMANPAFYRKFLVNRSETEGRHIYDLGNGQWDIPALRKLLEDIIPENDVIKDFEVEHDFPDLGHRIMHLNVRRIERKEGRNFILVAIEDVNDVVESRRALEESEALYNRLVEEINSIIIEVSPDGTISFFNRFAEKIFGYSRNELIGKQLVGTILPRIDSEGRDNSGLIAGMFQNPDQHYLNENVGIRKDGQEICFSWSARLIRAPLSENDAILIDGNDMTYVRQARKQARLALEMIQASNIPMVLFDPHKTCLIANETFAQLAGKDIKDIENATLMETGLPDDLIYQLNGGIDIAFQTGKEFRFETDYGRTSLLIRVEPEYEKTDGIGGSSIFFYDITTQKRAEIELGRLNQMLEQKVDERTRLAENRAKQLQELTEELIEAEEQERRRIADLLHDDLQQLLASAWIQMQMTMEQHPSIELLEKVESTLKESIEKSRNLSHELTPPVLQNGELADTIEWLAHRMKKQFGLRVRVERTAVPQLKNAPLKMFIFRAVQELLFNTVKHSEVEDAQVIFSRSDDSFSITVADRGLGFDPDILSSHEKVGLGLSSLAQRAHSIGCNLDIKSAPGQGSRITLTVPASPEVSGVSPGRKYGRV